MSSNLYIDREAWWEGNYGKKCVFSLISSMVVSLPVTTLVVQVTTQIQAFIISVTAQVNASNVAFLSMQ